MVWIFLFLIALLIFGAVSTTRSRLASLSNTLPQRALRHPELLFFYRLLTLLMSTAFVNSAAIRDFSHNTYQIIFSTPSDALIF